MRFPRLLFFAAALLPMGGLVRADDAAEPVPNLSQTDPRGAYEGGGAMFCGPVAVANSLLWLSRNGFPELEPAVDEAAEAPFELVRQLASAEFMDTNLDGGTGVVGVMNGVDRYLSRAGLEQARLHYQGWRRHPQRFAADGETPTAEWIAERLGPRSGVWVNLGWYRHDAESGDYERIGGHWVTAVAVDADEAGEPRGFVFHDPSPRYGPERPAARVRVELVEGGTLRCEQPGLPRSAAGYLRVSQGLILPRRADVAIIDAVVALEL